MSFIGLCNFVIPLLLNIVINTFCTQVFKKFPEFNKAINLHFIEISPKLKEMQQNKLCAASSQVRETSSIQSDSSKSTAQTEEAQVTKTGVKVHWWNDISELPNGPSFYVAHEFFDALPIHKFQAGDFYFLNGV